MSAIDARIDALLRGAAAQTPEERRLASLVSDLRAAAPHAPDALRARVLALEPRRVPRVSLPSRRTVLFALAGAAAVLVAVAGAIGVFRSGSPSVQHGEAASTVALTAGVKRSATLGRADSATPTTWSGAGGSSSAGGVVAAPPLPAQKTFAPQVHAPAVVGGNRLQHVDASLTLRVHDEQRLGDATSQAGKIVRGLGGYAQSIQYVTPRRGTGEAFLELRVPTNRVQDAIARLSDLGTIMSQQLAVQDLQRQLDAQTAQIARLHREILIIQETLKDTTLSPVDRVRLRLQLDDAQRALGVRKNEKKATLAQGATARISLVLTVERHAKAAPNNGGRFGRAAGDALSFLAAAGAVALEVLIAVSPLLVLGGLAVAARRALRRRDERQLLEQI